MALWEAAFNRRHLFEALDGQTGNLLFHINKMRIQFGELIYLPMLWLMWHSIRLSKKWQWQILFLWVVVPYTFFSLVATKMPAYVLFASPGILLITAFAWYTLRITVKRNKYYHYFLRLVALLLLLLPLRYTVERVKFFQTPLMNETVYQDALARFSEYDDKSIVFNEPFCIEAMFYSDCIAAYSWIPDSQIIDSLKAEGYQIIYVK